MKNDVIGMSYSCAPSFNDGYVVRVDGLGDALLVYAHVEKLKWVRPGAEVETGHKPVAYPRVIVPEVDANHLYNLLAAIRIPAISLCGVQVFDGVHCQLSIASIGYLVTVDWSAGHLPDGGNELLEVAEVLDTYARKSLES